MENKEKIIEMIFPTPLPTLEELEAKYPVRNLPEGAMVTRIAPSPTGFMHIGGLYAALISERFAHQTNGVFFLRIEDTDRKREVAGASELICKSLNRYGIKIDEGEISPNNEVGIYGPYKQSNREEIYKSVIKFLLEKDLAYPCFCTTEELEEIHNRQEAEGVRSGYYGTCAKWRDASSQEVLQLLEEKRPYVIRFKSWGDFNKKINIKDELLGKRELPENDQDIVIMKSDGLPTYHLAHVVDDHFMRTTHVIRGDEWLSSLPLHLQLFSSLGWKAPNYGHIKPIQKIEGSSKRKLSKRKDPEANVEYYNQEGYPEEAILEYLLNLANSDFENWRKANTTANLHEFILTFDRLKNSNGALFDFDKLNNISKEVVSRYSSKEVYDYAVKWAKQFNNKLAELLENNHEYSEKIFGVERSGDEKARKDIAKWSEVEKEINYFFDENFSLTKEELIEKLAGFALEDISKIVQSFMAGYNENDLSQEWFDKIKKIARENNYAESVKEFKKNPEIYKGNVADVAKVFRVLLTGRAQTPDLFSIMLVMGKERVFKRLSFCLNI